jgi:uncharacterized protein (UPF0262 family)
MQPNDSAEEQEIESSPEESDDSDSSVGDAQEENLGNLMELLFVSGKSKSNLGDALVGLCEIFKKHSCSKSLLSDVIAYIHTLMPENNIFPKTKHYFYKLMDEYVPNNQNNIKVKYSCAECQFDFGEKDSLRCTRCESTKTAVFVQNDLKEIVKNLFEHNALYQLVDEYKPVIENHDSNLIRDIVDGKKYQNVLQNKSPYDLHLIYNTDGFPVSGSSKAQVWPSFFTISDIRPNVRQSFIILQSLYYAPLKPVLSKILPSVTDEIRELGSNGVNWTHPVDQKIHNSKVHIICATVDAQARYPIQNINPYNSDNGCSFCEIKGKRMSVGRGTAHVYPFTSREHRERTTLNMVNNAFAINDDVAINARRNDVGIEAPRHVNGVAGYSSFALIDHFDLGSSFSPEYLHSCLLGVVKRQLLLITNSKYSSERFYVGKFVPLINKILKTLKPPNTFRRLPRSLDDLKNWKGSEHRNWLLFYSLPCLEKYWPIDYLKHHALLVFSIHTLLKDGIKKEELALVRTAMKEYCKDYSTLFRVEDQTFNLHMLLHYVSSVEYLGPLFSHSTFTFESANFKLGKSIYSSGTKIAKELQLTSRIHNFSRVLQLKCGRFRKQISTATCDKRIEYLGATKPLSTVDGKVFDFIDSISFSDDGGTCDVNFYSRASIDNIVYTTDGYTNAYKTCSSYAMYEKNNVQNPCKLIHFIDVNSKKYFIAKKINILSKKFESSLPNVDVEHILLFEDTEILQLCAAKSILFPLFVIPNAGRSSNEKLFCVPPNLVEINL